MMQKNEMIDEIIHLNPSVDAAFLAEFSYEELSSYLARLQTIDRSARETTEENLGEPALVDAT